MPVEGDRDPSSPQPRARLRAALDLTAFKQLIIDSLQLDGVTPEAIADEAPLLGEGLGLDSVDALELVVAIEKRLGVRIRAHQAGPEAFGSAAALYRFVEEQRAVQHAG